MNRILFVGGGTGGHFYPLIAVAEVVKNNPNLEMYYMGPAPYDKTLISELGLKFVYCPAGKLRLYFSIQNIFDIFRTFFGFFVAVFKLYFIYPDVIFSKGGYTSVPVLLAAKLLRIPVVIHESDSVPGRANLLAKNFARYIAISYPETAKYFDATKTALTGIPFRQALKKDLSDPYGVIGVPNDMPLIYVTGGSLGAERINNLVLRCLDELLPYYRIFHQVGAGRKEKVVQTAQSLISKPELQSRYYVVESVSSEIVNALLKAASIVITRAGSTTLFEIAINGKPSIVIPIPEDVSRDQTSNAYAYANSGAATILKEQNLTESLLTNEINSIMGNQARYEEMSRAAKGITESDAAEKIAQILLKIAKEHNS